MPNINDLPIQGFIYILHEIIKHKRMRYRWKYVSLEIVKINVSYLLLKWHSQMFISHLKPLKKTKKKSHDCKSYL